MTPGSIYFIKAFEYEDGGEPSDKLLIVLYIDTAKSVVVRALPTSQQKIPDAILHNGCTNNNTFSFFMFSKGNKVGLDTEGNSFSFDKNTFVFVKDNVNLMNIEKLLFYRDDRMKLIATLDDENYSRLLKCVEKSKHLKYKVKKAIEDLKNSLIQ